MHLLKNALFPSAIAFSLFALSVTFDSSGVHWMWGQSPVIGAVLGAVGLFFWFAFARYVMRLKRH